ncbi:MAG TPA: imidazolonepropionase [Acholeplasmatales bacterium]|nr:imidazolonepropionase [Acholeplasmatales bacterium]
MSRLIVHSISNLVTVRGKNSLRQGSEMNQAEILTDGFFVVENGKFIAIGTNDGYKQYEGELLDGSGKTITPGLIDSHTHLVHAGSRENELDRLLNQENYLSILKSGGGIHSTVKSTREAGFGDLFEKARKSLEVMLAYGVTTVEAKSGYGLNLETELKLLRVAKALNDLNRTEVVSTFMGAHAIPNEFASERSKYIDYVLEMLKTVKEQNLAEFCDVFCEEGAFSRAESETILRFASSLGLGLKIHADEITSIGGADLAADLHCSSAEHLLVSTPEGIKKLAASKTVATILPLTSLYLNKPGADARMMIENGCGLAIGTDYNPGTSPSENLLLAMQVAMMRARMTPKEIITAVTINAAASLGRADRKGSIEVGKDADFVIFEALNWPYVLYHFGISHVSEVFIRGHSVIKN